MRTREEILNSGTRPDILSLEVLLDIRDLLKKRPPRLGRPPKRKNRAKAKESKHG